MDHSLDDSSEGQRDGRLPAEALVGVVETALERALVLAAEAGRWDPTPEVWRREDTRDGISAQARRKP